MHNFSLGAFPFAFRDPIFFRDGRDRQAALRLEDQVVSMLAAFGHTTINEFVSSDYLKKGLHRSMSGAALNNARIPAFTAELGGYMTVDPVIVNAAVIGIRNVLRWAGMLSDTSEVLTDIRVISPGYPVRRMMHPYAPTSGIINYLVQSGDTVTIGDTVARISDIYGRPIGKNNGRVVTEYDGFVLGQNVGAVCYENDPLLSLAVRDESELILPYPA
jgi:predicted deacylase